MRNSQKRVKLWQRKIYYYLLLFQYWYDMPLFVNWKIKIEKIIFFFMLENCKKSINKRVIHFIYNIQPSYWNFSSKSIILTVYREKSFFTTFDPHSSTPAYIQLLNFCTNITDYLPYFRWVLVRNFSNHCLRLDYNHILTT